MSSLRSRANEAIHLAFAEELDGTVDSCVRISGMVVPDGDRQLVAAHELAHSLCGTFPLEGTFEVVGARHRPPSENVLLWDVHVAGVRGGNGRSADTFAQDDDAPIDLRDNASRGVNGMQVPTESNNGAWERSREEVGGHLGGSGNSVFLDAHDLLVNWAASALLHEGRTRTFGGTSSHYFCKHTNTRASARIAFKRRPLSQ